MPEPATVQNPSLFPAVSGAPVLPLFADREERVIRQTGTKRPRKRKGGVPFPSPEYLRKSFCVYFIIAGNICQHMLKRVKQLLGPSLSGIRSFFHRFCWFFCRKTPALVSFLLSECPDFGNFHKKVLTSLCACAIIDPYSKGAVNCPAVGRFIVPLFHLSLTI